MLTVEKNLNKNIFLDEYWKNIDYYIKKSKKTFFFSLKCLEIKIDDQEDFD